jgi:membrane fusion protein (multidrug efflux system)
MSEFTGVASEAASRVGVPEASAKAAPKKRARAPYVLAGLAAAAAVGGAAMYAHGLGREATDDAQIEGHVMNVSARVSGQVAKVLVTDNQVVKEGDIIVELDHAELGARVDAAKADLASAQAQALNAQAQLDLTSKSAAATLVQAKGGLTQASSTFESQAAAIHQGQADVAAAAARLKLAQAEADREGRLMESGASTQAVVDARLAELDSAKAQAAQADARLASAQAGTSGASGGMVFAHGRLLAAETAPEQVAAARAAVEASLARVEQAKSQLALAELASSYAFVRAPHSGQISRRTVEVGQMVGPDKPLLSIVPLDDVWVVANFKEDQLAEMRPGEAATVTVDTFGSREFTGHVDSIAGASGARFALLPPDNASGNFVKVVQRVPVLVRLDSGARVDLRPGLSANVTVRTKS